MSLWEYKILSSKQTPFSHPGLLESFLNALGKDQWEIISWRTSPDNPLEFEALARRAAYKEWYLEGPLPTPPAPAQRAESRSKKDADLRDIVLPENAAGEEDESIWEDDDDEETPENIFVAVRPFLKRNPQGNLLSASLEVLAGKFGVDERELLRAFEEEGMPPAPAIGQRTDHVEHEGLLFWLNRNQRGQTWINAKQKPKERPAPPPRDASEPVPDAEPRSEGAAAEPAASDAPAAEAAAADSQETAPAGEAPRTKSILDRVRPMMRRNKRGNGFSGSIEYLSRAMKLAPEALIAEIEALGLKMPATAEERMDAVAIGRHEWYFNRASNGQIWINGRDYRPDRKDRPAQAPAAGAPTGDAPVVLDAGEGVSAVPVEPAVVEAPALAEPVPGAQAEPLNVPDGAGMVSPDVTTAPFVETAPASAEPPDASDAVEPAEAETDAGEPEVQAAPEAEVAFLDGLREHMKRAKRGAPLSAELTPLAAVLGTDTIAVIEKLVRCGMEIPSEGMPARRVEAAGLLFAIERSDEGTLVLVAREKARKGKPRSRSRKPAAE